MIGVTTDDLPLCVGVFRLALAGENRLGEGEGLCGVVEREWLLFSATKMCAASKSVIFDAFSFGAYKSWKI